MGFEPVTSGPNQLLPAFTLWLDGYSLATQYLCAMAQYLRENKLINGSILNMFPENNSFFAYPRFGTYSRAVRIIVRGAAYTSDIDGTCGVRDFILSSAKSGPGTACFFHADVRATSKHTFERSCGHWKVCCVVAQTFA